MKEKEMPNTSQKSETKTNDKMPTFCKKELLERGWSQKAIDTLLPKPILKENPKYKCAAPMKLWEQSVVLKAEKRKAFKELKVQKEKHSAAGQKAAASKKAALLEKIENCVITVQKIDYDVLVKRTIREKRSWYDYQNIMRGDYYHYEDPAHADQETQERWQVNYIRHKLTKYDAICESLFNQVGKENAHTLLKNKVLDKIAETYPELAEECENQKTKMRDFLLFLETINS
jgi:hypothetical protein